MSAAHRAATAAVRRRDVPIAMAKEDCDDDDMNAKNYEVESMFAFKVAVAIATWTNKSKRSQVLAPKSCVDMLFVLECQINV